MISVGLITTQSKADARLRGLWLIRPLILSICMCTLSCWGFDCSNARTDDDVYDVAEIWLRQGYKGMLLGMDLATIHLARPVPETVPKVKIITEELAALVKPSKTPAKVIGWGETYPRIYGVSRRH